MKTKDTIYLKAIADRVQKIMDLIDLDVAGFAELFKKSTSHIYGILNLTRKLSEEFAKEIGEKLEFDGAKIFNLNAKIPNSIGKSVAIKEFKNAYKDNPEYFLSTKSDRSINTFVNEILLNSDFLKEGYKYLSEVTEYCKTVLNREFSDDRLSKALQYSVKINRLKATKKPIKLKNGEFGTRSVYVYYL